MSTITDEDELTLYRASRYLDLGFTEDQAFALAVSRGTDGFFLYWGRVSNMLKSGATRDQVVAIFV